MTGIDVSQYSPAVMQNRALVALYSEDSDALYDIEPDQIPYISYLRAIDSRLPGGIPGTMKFIEAQLSLSRSKSRKGRVEFGQAMNKQSLVMPQMPYMLPGQFAPQQEQKPGLLSKLFKKRGDSDV